MRFPLSIWRKLHGTKNIPGQFQDQCFGSIHQTQISWFHMEIKHKAKQSNACTMRLKNNNGATMNTHICSMVIWNCASNNRISLHPTYDCVQMDLDFGKGYTRLNVLTITYGNREYGQKRLNANRMQAKNERTEQTSELLMIKHQSRSHTNYHTHSTQTCDIHTRYGR